MRTVPITSPAELASPVPRGARPARRSPLVCAECGRQPRAADENAADEWRAYLDVSGRAVVILTGCQLLVTVC